MSRERNGREYSVVIEREDDGRYSAYVPDLPGCASMGDTRREALANVREAITCYLEGLRKLGRATPRRKSLVAVVKVKAALKLRFDWELMKSAGASATRP